MKYCKCGTPLGNLHGNSDTCVNCKPPKHEKVEHEYTPIMMLIEVHKVDKLNKQARIQRQIDKLSSTRQKIVYGILEMLLEMQGEDDESSNSVQM